MMTSAVFKQFVATAAEMRAADAATIASGVSGDALMDRAGKAVATAVMRLVGPDPVLVLCGHGNNGGDGYVIARELEARGWPVSVARAADPKTAEAMAAAASYSGPIASLADVHAQPILVDALFGTGMRRPLDRTVARELGRLMAGAAASIAVDVPSGVDTDTGALLGAARAFDMTVAIGALKPAHLLYPSAGLCGRIVTADIGIQVETGCWRIGRPAIGCSGPGDHKYKRGFVTVVGGAMPGAGLLSARAAQAVGAGYVVLATIGAGMHEPASIVQRAVTAGELEESLRDERIGAIVAGPGLGRDREASLRLDAVLAQPHPVVIDADALVLLARSAVPLARRLGGRAVVLTPHEGEFRALFGDLPGSRIERARAAARTAGSVVVLKGPDTVVAAPDGRAAVAGSPCFCLATAGTGDVLSGVIGTLLARRLDPFDAASAGVWIHNEAAHRAGAGLNADDLIPAVKALIADIA